MKLEELLAQARRNEQIQRRLDKVEDFMLGCTGLGELLRGLGQQLVEVYALRRVGLGLEAGDKGLREAVEAAGGLGGWCRWMDSQQLDRLGLGRKPVLVVRPGPGDVGEVVDAQGLGSAALVPLWAGQRRLGVLVLGDESALRYQPGLDTYFLERLGAKLSQALVAMAAVERAKMAERCRAVVEMAGAAAHELAQPLTTLVLGLERLAREAGVNSPLGKRVIRLRQEAERLGELVERIRRVRAYITRPYLGEMTIVDICAASNASEEEQV